MSSAKSSKKKILIVEDEPVISQMCQRVLAGEGFEVEIAVNGKVAQGMIDEGHYDYCLVDIRTPAMSGIELYQWLKETHPELVKKVIFTTGDVMSGDTPAFLQQAARPFIPKPFTPAELKNIIKQTLAEEEK